MRHLLLHSPLSLLKLGFLLLQLDLKAFDGGLMLAQRTFSLLYSRNSSRCLAVRVLDLPQFSLQHRQVLMPQCCELFRQHPVHLSIHLDRPHLHQLQPCRRCM
jgi:hypothetical protein